MEKNWGGYFSDSDSSVECGSGTVPQQSKQEDQEEEAVRYRVKLVDHGSTYAKVLYDVDGEPIVDSSGQNLSVWKAALKDEFNKGRVRVFHCMKEPTYRYFVRYDAQTRRFREERDNGAVRRKVHYHVYVDEDVDRNSETYRNVFVSPKN